MQFRRGCSGVWIAAAAAALDQLGKSIVRHLANPFISNVYLAEIPGLVAIRRVQNTGMAFSMFSGSTLALTLLSALLVAGVTTWLVARPEQPKLLRAGLWMIVGGGLGNLYDRIVYGGVTDFIEVLFVRFAIFNLADVFICVGAGLAALSLICDERKKEHGHERADH